jgi:hypothetical protein
MATSGPGRPTSSPAWPTPRWTACRSSPSPGRSAPRSSAPTRSRKRRSSRSAGHHQAPLPGHQRTEDIPRVVKEAFHIATSGRPGPVIIDVPKDVQLQDVVPDWDPPMNLPGYQPQPQGRRPRSSGRREIRESAQADHLRGGGIIHVRFGAAELREFAERPASRWP